MAYSTSMDGLTWAVRTIVRAASAGFKFSIWFDGAYLHYAYAHSSVLYYRRGIPNANGIITWGAEQAVATAYNKAFYPFISVDSYGYVWIGYNDFYLDYFPWVIKSGNNDGTWGTTPSGFPQKLSDTILDSMVEIIPLTAGKILAVYVPFGFYGTAKARRWNGSAWGTEVTTTSSSQSGSYFSSVAQGDDVPLVFLKKDTYDILYTKYVYATNSFTAETTLQAGAMPDSAPVISRDPVTDDLYVFWSGYPIANHIYYKKYNAGAYTWETVVDWIIEAETLTGNNRLTCFYNAYSTYIGLAYMTRTASPYNVRFVYMTVAVLLQLTLASDKTDYYTVENIILSGFLTQDGAPIAGSTITLYRNGVPHIETATLGDGSYTFEDNVQTEGYVEYYAEHIVGGLIFQSNSILVRR